MQVGGNGKGKGRRRNRRGNREGTAAALGDIIEEEGLGGREEDLDEIIDD